MFLVWGGDQQRLPTAYDVVATTVLLDLLRAAAWIRQQQPAIFVSLVVHMGLFTLLAFFLMGQRSNEYAPQLLAISDHGRLTSSCFEADPRTVCVNMAAEDCNGKQSGFVKVMVCRCVHIQMVYELSARHV